MKYIYIYIVVKTFKVEGPRKWIGSFWFFFHYLRWFLVVPPKDIFTWEVACCCAIESGGGWLLKNLLTTSNIDGSNLDVESMVVGNLVMW